MKILPLSFVLSVAMTGLLACSDGATASDPTAPGPLMRPGEQCLSCHRAGGQAGEKPWTAAGTVFDGAGASSTGVAGAVIEITGADGKVESLTTNEVGNFYTAAPIAKPMTLRIRHAGKSADMPIPLNADGACNACHSANDPIGGAAGRIRVP